MRVVCDSSQHPAARFWKTSPNVCRAGQASHGLIYIVYSVQSMAAQMRKVSFSRLCYDSRCALGHGLHICVETNTATDDLG